MRQREWLHFFNSCRLLAERIFVRQCRMDQQNTQACVTFVSYYCWVKERFFAVGSGLKESGILVVSR